MSAPVLTRINALARRLSAAKPMRASLVALAALVLAATLGFLFYKTQGTELTHYNAVLTMLRELKAIDARWDVEMYRARGELKPTAVPGADYRAAVARIQQIGRAHV